MILEVPFTERPDVEALHAALDVFGKNSVRWLKGSVEVWFTEEHDSTAVRAAVLSVGPTPAEPADDKRRRLVIEDLSKFDLVEAMLDPAKLEVIRAKVDG